MNGQKIQVKFVFRAHPGKDYQAYFVDSPQQVRVICEIDPHVVIVVLDGNSVTSSLSNNHIKVKATAFYMVLEDSIGWSASTWLCELSSNHGAPEAKKINRQRQIFNNYTNRSLKRQRVVDRLSSLGQ